MEGTVESGALDTLIAITGATEAVGTRLLQVNGGDLNAAVNSYFNEGPVIQPQRDEPERNDWMEEDEPAVGVPARGITPFRPHPLLSSFFNQNDVTSRAMPGPRTVTYGSSGLGRVAHPSDNRNIPIDWRDDDEDDGSSYSPLRASDPRIEDVPIDLDVHEPLSNHQDAMVDEEVPSTASSVFRSGGEGLGTRGRGGSSYPEEPNPDYNPNAPRIAEVPIVDTDEGNDIEEEMLRAAIEASKQEAAEASLGAPSDVAQMAMETGEGNHAADRPLPRTAMEDDDLARAVTLSLKTAEEEKALRERDGGPSELAPMQDDDTPFPEDVRKLDGMRRRGVARDRTGVARDAFAGARVPSVTGDRDRRSLANKSSGSSAAPIVNSPPDDVEEVDEQPLLRRRTSRRLTSSRAESTVAAGESQGRDHVGRGTQDARESLIAPEGGATASRESESSSRPASNEDPFPSDEWGGISSEEHDEAVMLEAALFGGLPERRGVGMPYQPRRGVHSDVLDALAGRAGANFADSFNRRGIPQPPSPTVVAQRLIREQQDDEFLASLAADREKELKAIEEAEARRLIEQEAAEAAASQERLRREEELRKQREAQELEQRLAEKKESLPVEPAADEHGALTLVVRLPDGSRRGRRFHKSNKLQTLFDFIDIGGAVKPGSYRLVRQYPRVAFTDGEHDSSLESLGLTSKQEVLLLELI